MCLCVQGEYIDISIGATLTISTMAAAGLGNLISDLAGLGLADRVRTQTNSHMCTRVRMHTFGTHMCLIVYCGM